MAVGAGFNFIFRPLYGVLEVYDAKTQIKTEILQVPGGSSVLGGLTWIAENLEGGAAMMGDVNGDCAVNTLDLLVLLDHYGSADATWSEGDLDGDAIVGANDLLLILSHWGEGCG
ncbi:MAG: hypothetical protein SYC29_06355 [Planctomycetota bacterium]|nr:hypothetical protein [Planctomycetota bacterium]